VIFAALLQGLGTLSPRHRGRLDLSRPLHPLSSGGPRLRSRRQGHLDEAACAGVDQQLISASVVASNAGEPGFGISACEYLAERKVILTGADTWAVEAVGKDSGGENPQPFECHIKMQTKRGIWNLENLDLTQLVADKAYEFLFVWPPLKMKGATGSPGNPIALY